LGRLRAFTGCPRLPGAGPAGLRWLPRSPPRRAGQSPPPLRATLFNPCRGRGGGVGGLRNYVELDYA
jgi:hypothetical protein